MSRYLLAEAAQQDLAEIHDYIGQDSPVAAAAVVQPLAAAFRKLARWPEIGHVREDTPDERIRFWNVHSYLIVYRIDRDPVHILRILHGARDIATILDQSD